IFRETTTLGLHWRVERKESLAREFVEVRTEWGAVRMKIARLSSGEVANAAPEYEDCRALAMQHAVPLKRVMQEAMRAWGELDKGSRG
ncbi:MAG TPA: nickel insertion protein, partial [Terracidiphilus sp.]|nr:nickel insertion protein [Terracidiphilus sp.]